jgi:hypothetical protein
MGESKMTKVYVTQSILDYQREMANLVRQTIRERFIAGVKAARRGEPLFFQVDLLPPPLIEKFDLELYEGNDHGLIQIYTSDDFGITNVHVVLTDAQGNLIEAGDAEESSEGSGYWGYITTVSVPAGTSVTVYAAAIDELWGLGALSTSLTILRNSTRQLQGEV